MRVFWRLVTLASTSPTILEALWWVEIIPRPVHLICYDLNGVELGLIYFRTQLG